MDVEVTWAGTELKLSQLENLERNNVRIQCIDSTDFVLGKQTNFNGPVTIINCPDVLNRTGYLKDGNAPGGSEQVIVREKVLSQSAANKMQKLAANKQVSPDDQRTPKTCRNRLPMFLCTGLLLVAVVVALLVFFTTPSTTDEPQQPRNCLPLGNNVCCYSHFDWGGRPTSPQAKPLRLPVSYLLFSSTHPNGYCYSYNVCLDAVRDFQLRQQHHPPCNFLLGGDGNVYEDSGWSLITSPDLPVPPDEALRVCFMGSFHFDYPTYPQVLAAKTLARFAVDQKRLAEDYVPLAWNTTLPIYNVIKKWPRFRNGSSALPRR